MKKITAVILSAVILLLSFSLTAFASSYNDKITKEEAIATALEAAGIKEEDLDYLYADHEEDFKLNKYPVWELKFGSNSTCYEYYIDVNSGEILPRYTSVEVKGDVLYMLISLFYSFANYFVAMFAVFDR